MLSLHKFNDTIIAAASLTAKTFIDAQETAYKYRKVITEKRRYGDKLLDSC